MNLDKENIKKLRGLIVFTILILVSVWNYKVVLNGVNFIFQIIFPFILGGSIAFILNVPMNFIERILFLNKYMKDKKITKKIAKPVSLVLSIVLILAVIALVIFVVVPKLGSTFISLGNNLQTFIENTEVWATKMFQDNKGMVKWINSLEFNWDKTVDAAISFFKNGAGNILQSTVLAAKSIISGLATFFIGVVFSVYILLQKETLRGQVEKVLHACLRKEQVVGILRVSSLTYRTFSNFLTGQCMEAIILGSMFFIIMTIFRFPYAMLIGVLIAFTALIPIFGAFIGCIVGAFLILMVNPMQALAFVILFLVIQQVEGNFIYPHVVGNSVGLPSIWVLVAVSVGGNLFGIVGMLVCIPVVSVLYTLFKEWIHKRLERKEELQVEKQSKKGERHGK